MNDRLYKLVALSLLWVASAVNVASAEAAAGVVRVAVASNFARTVEAMREDFEASGDLVISVSVASTGTLYAQIVNGAPFDVFLAADHVRPRLLVERGLALEDSRFTYAEGRLVLWSRDEALAGQDCVAALERDRTGRVAIANPRTAPYGRAARQALDRLGLWQRLESRLVFGENIGQTLQFVASGSARFGFVAAAQLQAPELPPASCSQALPASAHDPIIQQAVILSRAAGNPAAHAFLRYLRGQSARDTIARHGYGLPAVE